MPVAAGGFGRTTFSLVMQRDRTTVSRLEKSQIFRDYQRAFSTATELPVQLRPLDGFDPGQHPMHPEHPLCVILAESSEKCVACLRARCEAAKIPSNDRETVTCFAGLCESSIPIRVGEKIIGLLQTGRVALSPRSASKFKTLTDLVLSWGHNVDLKRLEDAYYHSKVLSKGKYEAMVRLLEIFALHLSLVANQLTIQADESELPLVRRARNFIAAHQQEHIDLSKVAGAVHVSTYYFCKMFKRATGLTFTDYLNRVRVERAREHLLKPHVRVSEVAYEVGFSSLTHFNRSFRRVVGASPTQWRQRQIGARGVR
jgi:AraC-like DNA-binding protein